MNKLSMKARAAVVFLIACSAAILSGCGDDSNTIASNARSSTDAAATPAEAPSHPGVTLTASPNPVPAAGGPGKTTITWNAGDHPDATVYVATDGASEALFAQGLQGSSEAPWIQAGPTYEFRLYNNADRQQLLSKVTVTGTK